MQKGFRLVANPVGTVLKVAVIEAQAGIDPDRLDPRRDRPVDFPLKIFPQGGGVIGGSDEVPHLANVRALHVAKDDAGGVIRDHAVNLVRRPGAGEVQDRRAGLQTGAGGGGLVRFHGKKMSLRGEGTQNRQQDPVLRLGVHPGGVGQGGLGAEVDEVSPFGAKFSDPLDR